MKKRIKRTWSIKAETKAEVQETLKSAGKMAIIWPVFSFSRWKWIYVAKGFDWVEI